MLLAIIFRPKRFENCSCWISLQFLASVNYVDSTSAMAKLNIFPLGGHVKDVWENLVPLRLYGSLPWGNLAWFAGGRSEKIMGTLRFWMKHQEKKNPQKSTAANTIVSANPQNVLSLLLRQGFRRSAAGKQDIPYHSRCRQICSYAYVTPWLL